MHADSDLSAYLDGELAPDARARVAEHLADCDRCRERLAELGATASLVAALPAPRPSRSLVPRMTQRWSWLRPVRALSAIATGAFLFAFLVTAIGRSAGGLGGGDESTAIFGGAGATAAASAPTASSATAAPARAPSALAAATAPAAEVASTSTRAAATAGPSGAPQAVAPAPTGPPLYAPAAPSAASGVARTEGDQTARAVEAPPQWGRLLDPLFWLGLAVIAAVAAIAAHMRLRTR